MPDYSKGRIYAIRASNTDDVYIGSTTKTLAQRLAQHRYDYREYQKGKGHYKKAFDMIGKDCHYIELLEEYSCKSVEELRAKEQKYIRETQGCINLKLPGRTPKECALEKRAEYYENRKVKYWIDKAIRE